MKKNLLDAYGYRLQTVTRAPWEEETAVGHKGEGFVYYCEVRYWEAQQNQVQTSKQEPRGP